MQKFLSVFLIASLMSSSAYSASTLKDVLSAYSYSVEVEWDQTSPEMLSLYQERLQTDLSDLMKTQSPDDLMKEALALSQPNEADESQLLIHSFSSGKIQKEEFEQKMLELYENSRTKGASWNGVTTLAVGAVSVLAISYLALRIYMYEWGKRL